MIKLTLGKSNFIAFLKLIYGECVRRGRAAAEALAFACRHRVIVLKRDSLGRWLIWFWVNIQDWFHFFTTLQELCLIFPPHRDIPWSQMIFPMSTGGNHFLLCAPHSVRTLHSPILCWPHLSDTLVCRHISLVMCFIWGSLPPPEAWWCAVDIQQMFFEWMYEWWRINPYKKYSQFPEWLT